MKEGVGVGVGGRIPKRTVLGYSLRSFRFLNSDDITQVLERDCGDDSIEIIHLKGLIVNQSGLLVAAVGGIPDKLKLDGGISFWFPCPIFKVSNNLPRDPTARHKALLEAYEKSSGKRAFQQGFIRAYKEAQGLCLSDVEEKEEDEAQNMDQQPITMVEVNLAAPLDPWGLYLNPESIPAHPIPTKQAVVESEVVKYGYRIVTFEAPTRGTITLLGRDCGDHIETTYLKGVVFNKPGYVGAVGGIPRNLRLNDGISFWFPCPTFKAPRNLPQDPTELEKVSFDVYVKGIEANKNAFFNAYNKALLQLKQPKEEEHGMDVQSCTMIEMNIAHPKGGIQYSDVMMIRYFEPMKDVK